VQINESKDFSFKNTKKKASKNKTFPQIAPSRKPTQVGRGLKKPHQLKLVPYLPDWLPGYVYASRIHTNSSSAAGLRPEVETGTSPINQLLRIVGNLQQKLRKSAILRFAPHSKLTSPSSGTQTQIRRPLIR